MRTDLKVLRIAKTTIVANAQGEGLVYVRKVKSIKFYAPFLKEALKTNQWFETLGELNKHYPVHLS